MELRWNSIASLLQEQAERQPSRTALTFFEGGWRTLTFAELRERVEARAQALVASGHKTGDRVALLSPTNLELPVEMLALARIGAVAVPLDPKLNFDELLKIIQHVEARTLIAAPEFRKLGGELKTAAGFAKLLYLGEGGTATAPLSSFPLPTPDSTLAIYYTSGTLGAAKGVMVSHRAALAEIQMLLQLGQGSAEDVVFSILPLHHLYGFTAGLLYCIAAGAEYLMAHSLAPADVSLCLQERRPTMMFVIPLFLQLIHRGIQKKFNECPPAQRAAIHVMVSIAPFLPSNLRRRLFASVHERLGGKLTRAVSGAAPLDGATSRFFRALGIPVFEGYGLTETGPVVSVNTPRRWREGTVGRPLPGVEVRLFEPDGKGNGEICTKGPHVMQGYFQEAALTAEVLQEGWFHTGDLGRLENGFLKITGRKKALVVLPSGKKVHAEEVELALSTSAAFAEVCVLGLPLGQGQGELLTAVVHPTEDFARLPDLQKRAEEEAERACRRLSAFKRPGRVIVKGEPFQKTASGKIKRHVVREEMEP